MADQVDIKISEDLVRGIIETKIQTAIIEALSSDAGVVERVVAAALDCKVAADGKRSQYSSDNKYTFLQTLCHKVLRGAAEAAVAKWAAQRQEVLETEFLKQLQTKKTSNKLVRACVEGLTEATTHQWRFSVNFPE